jgi:hypothetical protein
MTAAMTIFAIQVGPNLLAELVRIPHIPASPTRGLGRACGAAH